MISALPSTQVTARMGHDAQKHPTEHQTFSGLPDVLQTTLSTTKYLQAWQMLASASEG